MKRRRGIFLMDAIIGLVLLGIIGSTLAVATNRHQATMRRLANHRAAGRLAENSIASLQSRRALLQPINPLNKVTQKKLNTPAPAGMIWVEVDATVDGQSERIIGLTPQTALGGDK